MIEYTTPFDVAAEASMVRAAFPGTVLIVEGDTDYRVYDRFVDGEKCRVIPAHGKTNATDAISILEQAKMPGVLAIVDADFWRIRGISPPSTNVILTDAHDMETMILESHALDIVLREYAIKKRLTEFLVANQVTHLRDILFVRTLPLGLLRLISEEQSLSLKFKGLDYRTFVSITSLDIDETLLTTQVVSLTNRRGVSRTSVTKLLRQAKKRRFDPRQACCGHDLTAIMAIALEKAVARQNRGVANAANVEKWLRMAYDLREFRQTGVYSKVKVWQAANSPYSVLQGRNGVEETGSRLKY